MNKTLKSILLGLSLVMIAVILGHAQNEKMDKAVVPLSNPEKPALINVEVIMGSITLKGYEGKEVIVEAKAREEKLSDIDEDIEAEPKEPTEPEEVSPEENEKKEKAAGMKKIAVVSTGLDVEESENVVSIRAKAWKYSIDLIVQVPLSSSLKLRTVNDGQIRVENVNGEIEVENVNGDITLRNASGNVIAHTVNGDITVAMSRVAPDKPMSFSTMNGDIDVTLPADVKAYVKMKTQQGDVYSDFDVSLMQAPQKTEETDGTAKGKFHISFDKYITGLINGGGPEYAFNTFNGDIFIRKRK